MLAQLNAKVSEAEQGKPARQQVRVQAAVLRVTAQLQARDEEFQGLSALSLWNNAALSTRYLKFERNSKKSLDPRV